MRFYRRKPEFRDDTIYFVNDKYRLETFNPCLLEHSDGLMELCKEASAKLHMHVFYGRVRPTCVQTPSTASTITRAPSHSLDAVDTSLEKST